MNLPTILSQAQANSYYSRSDADALSAANSAGWFLYQAVKRELRGNFVKFDTTSIALAPGTSTYSLPADFAQLLHFSERQTTSEPYHPLTPTTIGSALDYAQQQVGWSSYWNSGLYGCQSPFSFSGPYLPAPTVGTPNAQQIYKMDITPAIDYARTTELAYIAKWVTLTTPASIVMLPDDAMPALLSLTTAYMLDMNGDTLANMYRVRALGIPGQANGEITMLLSAVRQNQVTRTPRAQLYGGS